MRQIILVILLVCSAAPVWADEAEDAVAWLERNNSPWHDMSKLKLSTTVFSDVQRIRITALPLRNDSNDYTQVYIALERSKSFSSHLPSEAISNLIEFIDRSTERHRGEAHAKTFLVTAIGEGLIDDATLARVQRWLPDGSNAQRSTAIFMLGAMPGEDPRIPGAVQALETDLEREPVPYFIEGNLRGLARLAAYSPLGDPLRDSLLKLATMHAEERIRIAAAEALIAAGPGARTDALSASLIFQLKPPNRLSRYDNSYPDPRTLFRRGVDALASLHEPPYPAQVVDAWIDAIPESLEVLKHVRVADQLSAPELAALEERAAKNLADTFTFAEADLIYDIVLTGEKLEGKAGELIDAMSGTDTSARYAAAFRLREIVRRGAVDPLVADAARRTVRGDSNPPGLRALAAEILVSDGYVSEDPVPTLVSAIEDASDPSLLQFLGPAVLRGLESRSDRRDLLIGYASQISRNGDIRAWLISQGLTPRTKGDRLTADQGRRVGTLASDDPASSVRRAAAGALSAFGVRPPLSSRIESGELPHAMMGYGYIALLIAYPIMLIVGLVLFRRWALAGWLGFSVLVLLSFGIAFLGMIGHNSLPPWQRTLSASWPLYGSFTLYALCLISAIIRRRARRPTVE